MCNCEKRHYLLWLLGRLQDESLELDLREELQPNPMRVKRMNSLRAEIAELQGRLAALPESDCEHVREAKKTKEIAELERERDAAARLIAEYDCGLDIDVKTAKNRYLQASLQLYKLRGEEVPLALKKLL